MRRRHLLPIALSSLLLALGACATTDTSLPPDVEIPADAVSNTRIESNGDVITEYRVAGQLHVVHVNPSRGPAYYLFVRSGQVHSTRPGDNPPRTYFRLFSW